MVNYSIDLGGIVTIVVVLGGFIFSIVRRNVEVGTLQKTVDKLVEQLANAQVSLATLQITVARLEERVTNMMRQHPPT